MKKILALILALALVLGLATFAFAADTDNDGVDDTIVIEITRDKSYDADSVKGDNTFVAYKIFDATYESNSTTDDTLGAGGKGVAYFINKNSAWINVVKGMEYKAATEQTQASGYFDIIETADETGYVITLNENVANTADTAKAIAKVFKDAIATVTLPSTYEAASYFEAPVTKVMGEEDTKVTFTNMVRGYYLITSDLGENLIIATTDITITEKNTYPDGEKSVSTADLNAEIGKVIEFTLKVNVPAGANQPIKLTDTMQPGLTYKEIDAKATNGTDEIAYEFTAPVTDANGITTFSLLFDEDTVIANQGKTITIKYRAMLNEKAVTGIADPNGFINDLVVDYGENYTSEPYRVNVDSQAFTFEKVDDQEKPNQLPGAKFEFYRYEEVEAEDGSTTTALGEAPIGLVKVTVAADSPDAAYDVYRLATADDNAADIITVIETTGKPVKINGVDKDLKYALVETEAPKGYNKLANPVDVVPQSDKIVNYTIVNEQGTTLPSTGGIGTTIFYIVGSMMAVGAGIILVTKKRIGVEA